MGIGTVRKVFLELSEEPLKLDSQMWGSVSCRNQEGCLEGALPPSHTGEKKVRFQ